MRTRYQATTVLVLQAGRETAVKQVCKNWVPGYTTVLVLQAGRETPVRQVCKNWVPGYNCTCAQGWEGDTSETGM